LYDHDKKEINREKEREREAISMIK